MPDKKRKNLHNNVMNNRALSCTDILVELRNNHIEINKVRKVPESELTDLIHLQEDND